MHLIRVFMRYDGNDFPHFQLGVMKPGVVFALAPDDLRKDPARLQRGANISQCNAWQRKKHGPEPRERTVIRAAEIVALHVGREKTRIRNAHRSRFALGSEHEVGSAVDPDGFAARPDGTRDFDSAVAEAAAYVQDPRALRVQIPAKNFVTV